MQEVKFKFSLEQTACRVRKQAENRPKTYMYLITINNENKFTKLSSLKPHLMITVIFRICFAYEMYHA